MSANLVINENTLAKHFSQILNIGIDDDLTMQDMIDDLKSIENLAEFRAFVKTRFNYERFRYLTGYQKFVALVNEFKRENKPKLDTDNDYKVRKTSETLFRKVSSIFDEIDYLVQTGYDIQSKKVSLVLFRAFGAEDEKSKKTLEVLEKIGKRQDILNLLKRDRKGLEEKIKEIVYDLTLMKQYPEMAIENKNKRSLKLENIVKRPKNEI